MKVAAEKTNVMRILEQKGIAYTPYYYSTEKALSGAEVAKKLNKAPEMVFKTLVTEGKSGNHFVFVIPVESELDLKKAANSVGEKSIAMLKSKDLLPLTGYIHGGCSPIGMKKLFTTVFDEIASIQESIIFSAGRIGYQVEISPGDLSVIIPFSYADLTV